MATRNTYLFTCLCLLTVIIEKTNAECPIGWIHYGNSCYHFSQDSLNWYLAESSCRGHNARLAEVYTKAQSDFLINEATRLGGNSYWLGGRDDLIEGTWIWASTDKQFTYTAWHPGNPSNSGGNEDCVHLHFYIKMLWNDNNCATAMKFICEKEYPVDNPGSEIIG